MKDLLRIADLSADDFDYLLSLAADLKTEPRRYADLLAGDIVALYFAKPSTRTRFSFEAAIRRLGGAPVFVGPAELQLSRGETIEDTARTLSHFARALVVRTFAHNDLERFAAAASIPVINALSDEHHPCQALADVLTLRERFQPLRGRKVAYVGDGNNVAHSLIEAAALEGFVLHVATPPGHGPDAQIVARAHSTAGAHGPGIVVGTDPVAAVTGAVAVYTDTWFSMGSSPGLDRGDQLDAFRDFQVNESLLVHAEPGAVFMHCLPAHRGEEVSAEVMDGPRSIVFEQVENRGHTEQAVLKALIERSLHGARAQ